MKKFLQLSLVLGLLLIPTITNAAGLVPCGGSGEPECAACHVIQLLANTGNFLISITGALVFAMFLYGAFYWIISAGNEKRVAKGKTIMTNAFIGVLVVFLSYSIVTFVIMAITGTTKLGDVILFGKKWGDLIECVEPRKEESKNPTPDAKEFFSEEINRSNLQNCKVKGVFGSCLTLIDQRDIMSANPNIKYGNPLLDPTVSFDCSNKPSSVINDDIMCPSNAAFDCCIPYPLPSSIED